jgi:hypothetical protein
MNTDIFRVCEDEPACSDLQNWLGYFHGQSRLRTFEIDSTTVTRTWPNVARSQIRGQDNGHAYGHPSKKHSESHTQVPPPTVLYLLTTSTDQKLKLKVVLSKQGANGEWNQTLALPLDLLVGRKTLGVTVEDNLIGTLLLTAPNYIGWTNTARFPEMGTICVTLMAKLLKTGRCFWHSENSAALSAGKLKQGKLEWQIQHDGKQKLRVTGESGDFAFFAGIAWYVDAHSSTLGALDLGVSEEELETAISAPPIACHEAESAAQQLKQLNTALPLPCFNFSADAIVVKPHPTLTLTSFNQIFDMLVEEFEGGHSHDEVRSWRHECMRRKVDATMEAQAIAIIEYDYPIIFAPDQFEARVIENGRVLTYRKDTAAEARFEGQIEKLGLKKLHQKVRLNAVRFPTDNQADWLKFMVEGIPWLQEHGWLVVIDQSYKYSVAIPEEQWQLDAVKGTDFWFSLSIGITVDGVTTPLLPIIHEAIKRLPNNVYENLLRNWRGRSKYTRQNVQICEELFNEEADSDTADEPDVSPLDQFNQNGKFYAPMPDGRYVALPFERVKTIVDILLEYFDKDRKLENNQLDWEQIRKLAKATKNLPHEQCQVSSSVSEAFERIRAFECIAPINPPNTFKAKLRPYQVDGIHWLNFLRHFELGGILADDMGLGKTIQTLAHIDIEKAAGRLDAPALIICPTSVRPNWQAEVGRFVPHLNLLPYCGPQRAQLRNRIAEADIVLTTYPTVMRDGNCLEMQKWKCIILDEAQAIKNSRTKLAIKLSNYHADYRISLTGTPIENHLGELWAQFNFLMPGYLGSRTDFDENYREPIEEFNSFAARERLKQKIRPFMLRRVKEEVLQELPEKNIEVRSVELTGAQRDLYETVRLSVSEMVKQSIQLKGLEKSRLVLIVAMLRLRQICCDPRLSSFEAASDIRSSAKLKYLVDMLEELIGQGKKILLFSQFTPMLDLIINELNEKKISFVQIRGGTVDRTTPVKMFQEGEVSLFLISLRAGGTGLNLTAADTVIHFDSWWNPAVENQATDRAHRIGQNKNVTVYKLVAKGTIEERMLQLHKRKKDLADLIYDADHTQPTQMTRDEIESLFAPID